MSKKDLFVKRLKNYLPAHTRKSIFILNRHISFGILAFIILVILFNLLTYQRHLILKGEQKRAAYVMVNHAKDKLQEALASGLSATKILSFFIDNNGSVNNFDSVAPYVFSTNKNIDVLELVPDGVIRYVYPLKGNEEVMGYNILKDPARNKEAFTAIQKKELFFSGPYNLKQGGFGIVGRLPVFRNGKFWGFSAVVIKVTTLLKAAGIDSTGKDGYYYQLSKINPDTKKAEFFIPHLKEPLRDYNFSVDIPDGAWKLSVEPVDNYTGKAEIFILVLLGFLFSVLGAILVAIIVKRPQKLERLVKERTKELKSSENKYRSLIERVSDAFVSLDNNWNYVYINKKAGEIFGRKPESLFGKNMWKEFPEGIDHPFYHAYYRAMETQQYQYLEEYYPLHEKWFEHHIYPSKDGLTVFFKDVTEIKKVSSDLKENEEKYRSLIEQASDGIILTDLDGYIIEVNNSIAQLSGYSVEEMPGKHLYSFLPEEDAVLNPLRFNDLMGGKTLLYERRLLKKDGTVLDIEVHSKMASSQTLIGFIRDITERKKTEAALKEGEEKFSKAFHSNTLGFAIYDADFRIVDINDYYAAILESTRAELLGKTSDDAGLISKINAEKRTAISERIEEILKAEGHLYNFEIEIEKQSGIPATVLLSIEQLELNNKQHWLTSVIDITVKKKAEQDREHEELTRKLIMSSALDAIIGINTQDGITLWNPQAEKIFGWSEKEIKGKLLTETIIPLQYREQHVKGMKHYLKTGQGPVLNRMIEITALDKQGREFPIELSIIPLKQDGKQTFCAFIRDISDRKQAAEKLKKREAQLLASIENTPNIAVQWYNNKGEVLYWNPASELMYGWTLSEAIGKTLDQLINTPEEAEDFLKALEKVDSTGSTIGPAEFEFRRKNGTKGSCMSTIFSIPSDGEELCFVCMDVDITERKKAEEKLQLSEEKYRLLFYNNPLPMWMTIKPGLDIIDVNEAAINHYGYSREEFLKLNARDMRPEEDVEDFIKEVKKMKPGINHIRGWRHKKKDGTIIHVETYSHEIDYEGKKVWLGLSHDVTEKYQAKELLQRSYEDIRQLAFKLESIREDERTNIAREIHDELGQQLTGLKMDMHWLARKINSTDGKVINKMTESIELINATISTVRKIATELRPSILDDLGLLAALEWQSEEFEKRSGITVKFINETGNITVLPEITTALFRIYQELLTNIARHANARLVTASLHIDDKKRLYFSIADNGIGFNPDTINKKTLGLLGIRERALLIGGTYEIKTKPGEGTETIISIPLR